MLDRISNLLKAKGLSSARFADSIGVQRSSVSHVLSGRNKPSLDFILKILKKYQEINPDWLLTGTGNMLRDDNKDIHQQGLFNEPKQLLKEEPVFPKKSTERPENKPKHDKYIGMQRNRNATSTDRIEEEIEKIVIFFRNKAFKTYYPED